MIRRGINEKKARALLSKLKAGQEVMDQLEYVDSIIYKDAKGRVENPPGLYVFYVRDNIQPPADFPTIRKQRLQEQAQQAKHVQRARSAQLKIDYETYCTAEAKRYIQEALSAEDYQELFRRHDRYNRGILQHMPERELTELTEGTIRAEILKDGRITLPSFEEFCRKRGVCAA